jgi:hypothetical protein
MAAERGIKCWCVVGDEGEYSDWTMWLVVAFEKKAEADDWAEKAQAWVDLNKDRDDLDRMTDEQKGAVKNPYDPEKSLADFPWDAPRYQVHELDPLQLPGGSDAH